MKTTLVRYLSLATIAFVATACVLVENFEGYEPLGNGGACDVPDCSNPTTSGNGGNGVGGNGGAGNGSSSSVSSSSGGDSTCAMIPCSQMPCPAVEIIPDSPGGILTIDPTSIFIASTGSNTTITRVAKPGCVVPPFAQQATLSSLDHVMVSDGSYAAWITHEGNSECTTPTLRYCNPNDCQPQEIQADTSFPGQGQFLHLDLGPDHVYFTMYNGLAGRLAKASGQAETIWIDPGTSGTKKAFLGYPLLADGKLFATRIWIADEMSICLALANVGTSAIWLSDPTPLSTPTAIATNILYLGHIAVDPTYLYFYINDGLTLLNRMPKMGGTAEPLNIGNTIKSAPGVQNLVVKNGFLYMRAASASGSQLVVRLPANTPVWSEDAIEVVAEAPYIRTYGVDDMAVYWEECTDPSLCEKSRIMARRLIP